MKSPIDLLVSFLTDVRRLIPDVKGTDSDIITIRRRLKHEGESFLTLTLPSLFDSILDGIETGRFTCPRNFKRVPRGSIPRFLSGMICEVFDVESGLLRHDASSEYVKVLREMLYMFKKLKLDTCQEEFLDKKAKSKFIKDDQVCLSDIVVSEKRLFILDLVSRYILPNLDSFDIRELPVKHGPGAVFEGYVANQKWRATSSFNPKLESMGFDMFYWSNPEDMSDPKGSNTLDTVSSSSIARLITVPKNSSSRRTITVEPLMNQFIQQGFNTILRDSIEKCSILSACLALTDQTKNQILALEGSHTRHYATIDLRSASDLLSNRLVGLVFKHRPIFLDGVRDCRSSHVDIDGNLYQLEKYAGMGNATTFPVQSVVFAVLAISALLECEEKYPTYGSVRRAARRIRVYGDDIIVPTIALHQVVDWIESFGLSVNRSKTFSEGFFRESCGVDAYKGVDVTPLYVRHSPINVSKKEPNTLAHYVSLSNQAWLKGLYTLSTTLRNIVEEEVKKTLPLVCSTSGLLGLHTRQDAQEFHRWNSSLHRPETKGLSLSPLKRRDALDGYGALLKFYLVPFLGRDAKHLEKSPVRFSSKLTSRWGAR